MVLSLYSLPPMYRYTWMPSQNQASVPLEKNWPGKVWLIHESSDLLSSAVQIFDRLACPPLPHMCKAVDTCIQYIQCIQDKNKVTYTTRQNKSHTMKRRDLISSQKTISYTTGNRVGMLDCSRYISYTISFRGHSDHTVFKIYLVYSRPTRT